MAPHPMLECGAVSLLVTLRLLAEFDLSLFLEVFECTFKRPRIDWIVVGLHICHHNGGVLHTGHEIRVLRHKRGSNFNSLLLFRGAVT
jgi:hypothetical protein